MNNTQKGITLIALVITIIVMLTLAAVVMNLIINGGLIEQTDDVAISWDISQTKGYIHADLEALIAEKLQNKEHIVGSDIEQILMKHTKEFCYSVPEIDYENNIILFEQEGLSYKTPKGNIFSLEDMPMFSSSSTANDSDENITLINTNLSVWASPYPHTYSIKGYAQGNHQKSSYKYGIITGPNLVPFNSGVPSDFLDNPTKYVDLTDDWDPFSDIADNYDGYYHHFIVPLTSDTFDKAFLFIIILYDQYDNLRICNLFI